MEIKIKSKEDLEHLIRRWEKQRLPKVEWTHEAHIAVAVWYNWHFNIEEALNKVRPLIIAHNESVGTPNSDHEGYHETITKFWIIACANYLKDKPAKNPIEAHLRIMQSEICQSKYPLEFYSEKLLFSINARHNLVEPDKKSISGG